jgi:hypothetical protein
MPCRPPRLLVRALAGAVLALLLPLPVASVAAGISILPPGGGAPRTIELSDLAGRDDVHDARFALRAADGAMRSVHVAAGFTLGTLLDAAGIPHDAFTHVELPRGDGTSVLVLADQLAGGLGDGPPVVWADAEGTHVLRPLAGPRDVNADDLVTPAGGVVVLLRTGDPVGVRIDASALRVRVGEAVGLTAVLVAGERPAAGFTWYFDDGAAGADGTQVSHRFTRAGTYNVLVNVVEDGRQLDAYDVATVQVRASRRERRPHARRPRERRDRPAHEPAAGGPAAGGPGGSGHGSVATPRRSAAAGSARTSPRRRRPEPAPRPVGDHVEGTLLGSASATPPAAAAAAAAALGKPDGTSSDSPLRVPMLVWDLIGIAAILALGWALEARYVSPFWRADPEPPNMS